MEQYTTAGLNSGRLFMARKTGVCLSSVYWIQEVGPPEAGVLLFGIRAVGHILVCGLRLRPHLYVALAPVPREHWFNTLDKLLQAVTDRLSQGSGKVVAVGGQSSLLTELEPPLLKGHLAFLHSNHLWRFVRLKTKYTFHNCWFYFLSTTSNKTTFHRTRSGSVV